MMKTRSLGKIFGVEVKVHGTFLLLLAFLALSGLLNGGLVQASLSLSLSVIVFGIVVCHEFGHILAARKFGFQTRDVILSPLGGMARLEGLPSKPYQEMLVAAAGPAVNLALAGLGSLAMSLISASTLSGGFFSSLLGWFVTINLVLMAFNLIPALPMDGGRILRALLTKKMGRVKATETAAKVARWSALLMAVYAVTSGQLTLLLISGFVFVMSWMEVFQAKVQAAQQNPAYRVFQAFNGQPGFSQSPFQSEQRVYSNVVDQYGRPVGDEHSQAGWTVRNVRWADDQ